MTNGLKSNETNDEPFRETMLHFCGNFVLRLASTPTMRFKNLTRESAFIVTSFAHLILVKKMKIHYLKLHYYYYYYFTHCFLY